MADAPRAFVCGYPIGQSKSPAIHRYWLDQYGLQGSYEAVELPVGQFTDFFCGLPSSDWIGGNITIPHKEAAFRLCHSLDEAAAAIGAVNTVWVENNGICGSNTDAAGFQRNLDEQAPDWPEDRPAVVLGAGGAARAVLHVLSKRRCPVIHLVNRTYPKAESMAREFGDRIQPQSPDSLARLLESAGLLVNTTSLGMRGQPRLSICLDPLPADSVVADIVYNPLETGLLTQARQRGVRTVDGLGMLLHQAAPGFFKWFGIMPQVTPELRRTIQDTLLDRQ